MLRVALFTLLLAPTTAWGEVQVLFEESAPKDRFTISNAAACDLGDVTVVIDLSGSAAGLIFDTTGAGAGVEVYQPFELVSGAERVQAVSAIADGDQRATLSLTTLPAKAEVSFTIDVDDTLPSSSNGAIMISGAEIEGARLIVTGPGGGVAEGAFDQSRRAVAEWGPCVS